ncbi:major capsid protein [Tortoise microvirus 29]|nr:major capsid protein [Tortoise microvirus 29]
MASNIFNSIAVPNVSTNVFDLSHDVKMSLNMGGLYPVYLMETVPGDKIKIRTEALLRFAPLVAPVMHHVNVFIHFFEVPNRILWPGFEDFISGNENPPAAPYLTLSTFQEGSLGDYLGLPTGVSIDKFSCLPFAAYQAVYNEYYRDQNLVPEVPYKLIDGDNGGNWPDLLALRKRAWQHDYFTAALPFAQKGDPVTIPLSGDAPVNINYSPEGAHSFSQDLQTGGTYMEAYRKPTTSPDIMSRQLYAELDQVNSVSVNDLRFAIKLQEWLEKNARGGTRYKETIKNHFDVNTSDGRLQRPQYLGGTMSPMVISEVLQTSATEVDSPQGTMSGHGISVTNGKEISHYCEEHGFVIGIMSVMPKTAYSQGVHKQWSRFDRLDYYWPTFAHLGEQEVKNRELYYGTDGENDNTFGYVPRYAEYKYLDGRVAGEMRSSLSFWHMGRTFSSRPHLNRSFIECDPGRRFFAVQDPGFDTIYAQIIHNVKAVRKMPKFGIPQF